MSVMITDYWVTDSLGRPYWEGRIFPRDVALIKARDIPIDDRPFGVWLVPAAPCVEDPGEQIYACLEG